jgi:hypothetical protein
MKNKVVKNHVFNTSDSDKKNDVKKYLFKSRITKLTELLF